MRRVNICIVNSESVFDSVPSGNTSYETLAAVASRQSAITASQFYEAGLVAAAHGASVKLPTIV